MKILFIINPHGKTTTKEIEKITKVIAPQNWSKTRQAKIHKEINTPQLEKITQEIPIEKC